MKHDDIKALRREYRLHTLRQQDVHKDPIQQFAVWFDEALNSQLQEPNAMTLATCTPDGKPSARIVLLKEYDPKGFVFYTNYESRKGKELADNPHAALLFSWLELERQVRIEGLVEKIDHLTSEQYFQSRPKSSQIGAWASPQSNVIPDRAQLEQAVETFEQRYAALDKLPCPSFWGGYRVVPYQLEFWQGRSSRLHDRIRYTKTAGDWQIERLAP